MKFDIYGLNNIQPIWADHYLKTIANTKNGFEQQSQAEILQHDRITQIVGNGLVCLIDEKLI